MKILCLIDSLNSGGAQRQLCMLAVLLKRNGYDVEVLTYYDYNFYRPLLDSANMPVRTATAQGPIGRIFAVRKAIYECKPDVVIAYMGTPTLMAELATLPRRKFRLIVSERSSDQNINVNIKLRLLSHRLADAVLTNSYTQADFIRRSAPTLADKIQTIINCVDLNTFKVIESPVMNSAIINLVVVARFHSLKNPMGLVNAMNIVHHDKGHKNIAVNWYGDNLLANGKPTKGPMAFLAAKEAIKKYALENFFSLHGPVLDVARIYQSATALCLPSLYEGCSNVIGEAMACGKPILASNVCDNSLLVKDGENGFLFDPKDPQDIAAAIIRFAERSPVQLEQMGQASRKRAEKMLSPDVFVNKYIELIKQVTATRKRL